MIEEIQIAQLDPRQIKQLEAADKAFSKDPNYSFEVFSAILKQSQNCLELRKKLRLHQLQLAKNSSNKFGSLLGKFTSSPFSGLLRNKSKKDPEATIWAAEQLIAKNPYNIKHQTLANAFEELEMHTNLVFAYETIRKIQPKIFQTLKN